MIKTIVFDLGGVIFAQSFEGAIRHFEEIGVKDARKILDPFTQLGFFGDLESGKNTNPFMMMWAMSPEFDGKEHPLSDYFDACYLSYECRMVKPSKEIFQMVLEREGIKPEETLFIDDSERNVLAAQALGIQTICPKDNADWTNDVFSFCGIIHLGNGDPRLAFQKTIGK